MKKLLLTALLCFCVNAYANDDKKEPIISEDVLKRLRDVTGSKPKAPANWKYVYEDRYSGNEFYIDIDSIKNVKNRNIMFEYTILEDYLDRGASSHVLIRNIGQLSVITKKKRVKCRSRSAYAISVTYYSQQMGQGKVLYKDVLAEDEGYFSLEHKPYYEILKYVCGLHGTTVFGSLNSISQYFTGTVGLHKQESNSHVNH